MSAEGHYDRDMQVGILVLQAASRLLCSLRPALHTAVCVTTNKGGVLGDSQCDSDTATRVLILDLLSTFSTYYSIRLADTYRSLDWSRVTRVVEHLLPVA